MRTRLILVIQISIFFIFGCKPNENTNNNQHLNIAYIEEKSYEAVQENDEIKKGEEKSKNYIKYMNGKIVEETENSSYDMLFKHFYEYDNSGNVIKQTRIKNNIDTIWVEKYTYDNNDHQIERSNFMHYKSDGSLNFRFVYIYDQNGIKNETIVYKGDNNLFYKLINKYNDRGNLIEENRHEADGSVGPTTSYTYDENGNEIKKLEYSADGVLLEKIETKYDYNKNIISLNSYDSKWGLFKRESKYDYDEKENWIKRIDYREGKVDEIKERVIVYAD